MKKKILLLSTLLMLVAINYSIAGKERVLHHGTTMLLRLAPLDPRSLMQGDYMALRYALASEVPEAQLSSKGRIVVSLDENQVASFVRLDDGRPLSGNEHLLLYRNRDGLRLGAESFFFQEGTAPLYARARYGELRVEDSGASVLTGLRGEDFAPLGPPGSQGKP